MFLFLFIETEYQSLACLALAGLDLVMQTGLGLRLTDLPASASES